MRPFSIVAAVLSLCALAAHAQTVTTVDEFGETVVEVITVDPDLGLPTTETLATLTSTSTTTTTTDAGQVGPVGEPATTTETGETLYTYTTTDANGETIAVEATFTPTYATSVWTTPPAGTVLDYSSWRASVGSNTVAVVSSSVPRWSLHPQWLAVGAALGASLAGGAWLVLA